MLLWISLGSVAVFIPFFIISKHTISARVEETASLIWGVCIFIGISGLLVSGIATLLCCIEPLSNSDSDFYDVETSIVETRNIVSVKLDGVNYICYQETKVNSNEYIEKDYSGTDVTIIKKNTVVPYIETIQKTGKISSKWAVPHVWTKQCLQYRIYIPIIENSQFDVD